MTPQEAISNLKRAKCVPYKKETLEMAIKALEREPCEDAISRQAVLSKIKEVCFSEEWIQFRADKGSNGQRDFLINYIEQQPSVTPQSKTGRWIDGKCNRCGTHAPYWAMASGYYLSEYCPTCGAKMTAESEVEE